MVLKFTKCLITSHVFSSEGMYLISLDPHKGERLIRGEESRYPQEVFLNLLDGKHNEFNMYYLGVSARRFYLFDNDGNNLDETSKIISKGKGIEGYVAVKLLEEQTDGLWLVEPASTPQGNLDRIVIQKDKLLDNNEISQYSNNLQIH